jgi:hypothetical protein
LPKSSYFAKVTFSHILEKWRWSFFGVHKMRDDNFKPRFAFQQWNSGQTRNKKLKMPSSEWARWQKVRKPLVVSISQKSEQLRLYNLV